MNTERTNEFPEPPDSGFINLTLEKFSPCDLQGVRTDVIRESMKTSTFIHSSEHDLYIVFQRMVAGMRKEILTPSVKTDMV